MRNVGGMCNIMLLVCFADCDWRKLKECYLVLVYSNPSMTRGAAACAGQTACVCGALQSLLAVVETRQSRLR